MLLTGHNNIDLFIFKGRKPLEIVNILELRRWIDAGYVPKDCRIVWDCYQPVSADMAVSGTG